MVPRIPTRAVVAGRRALLLGLAAAAVSPGFAHAADVAASPRLGPPGSAVFVSGAGFAGGEPVRVAIAGLSAGTLRASSGGRIAGDVLVPADLTPGPAVLTAEGAASQVSVGTPFRVRTNWSQLGRAEQHTFANPFENTLDAGNAASLRVEWRAQAGSAAIHPAATVASGRVYVGSDDGSVRAFGTASGRPRWRRDVGAPVRGQPAAAYGLLFVATGDRVIALDPASGQVRWKSPLKGTLGSPVPSDGRVVVQNDQGDVWALDPAAGAVLWKAGLGSGGGGPRTPTVDDARVFAVVDRPEGDRLVALNSETGTVRWNVGLWPSIARSAQAGPSPGFDVADPVAAAPPPVWVAVVGSGDPSVTTSAAAFDVRTGALVTTGTLADRGEFSTALAVDGGLLAGGVVGGSASGVGVLGASPSLFAALGAVPAGPPVIGPEVIVTSGGFGVRVLARAGGALLWSSTDIGPVLSAPVISDGRLFVTTSGGSVVALAPVAPPTAPASAPGLPRSAVLEADRRGPRLTVRVDRRQRAVRRGALLVRVRCDEACRATASGSVATRRRAHSVASWTRVRPVRQVLAAGRERRFDLRLTPAQRRDLSRALSRAREVNVPLTVVAVDGAGNRARVARRVDVTG